MLQAPRNDDAATMSSKETIKPAFGIVKSILGFDQFLMRGVKKFAIEWDLVMFSCTLKRLHRLEITQGRSTLSQLTV